MVVGVEAPAQPWRRRAAASAQPDLGQPDASAKPPASPAAPPPPSRSRSATSARSRSSASPTTGYARTATRTAASRRSRCRSPRPRPPTPSLVADAVTAKLDESAAPSTPTSSRSRSCPTCPAFIKESRDGLLREGGLGALFAVLTIFLFLASLRSTLVAAVSIPLSMLAALVIMQITGITLNIMTLGGLAVAVGRVVDDAIVVLENIYRHRAMGEDRLEGLDQRPARGRRGDHGGTVTTVGVFLPLGFVGGLVSQFFLPFALTVTFALLASLVVRADGRPGPRLLAHRPREVQRRRGRRAQELVLDPRLHAGHQVRPPQPLDEARRGRRLGRPVRRDLADRAAPADPVHQRGLREDPRRSRSRRPRAPPPQAVLERATAGRGRSCSPIPTWSSSRPASPARARRASRRSSPHRAAGPANSARMTVRLVRRRRPDGVHEKPRRRSRRSRPTATTSRSPRPRASPRTTSTSSSRARTPTDVAAGQRRGPRRAGGQHRPAQPQDRPVQGHARDPGHARPEQGDRRRPHGRPGRGGGPRRARRARPRRRCVIDDGRPTATSSSSSIPSSRDVGRGPPGAARRARSPRCRWARSRPSSRSTPRASITRIDQSPGRVDHGRDRRRRHRRGQHGRAGGDRRARGRAARSRPASTSGSPA